MQRKKEEELRQLNLLLQQIFNKFKGPHLLQQSLIKLIMR